MLSVDRMKSLTEGTDCYEEGDYLAWKDMEWILHGQARVETTDEEETCNKKPLVDLYNTRFPGMDSCMHHCENMGTRAPELASHQEWTKIQRFLMNLLRS